jgi:hypothetical protein
MDGYSTRELLANDATFRSQVKQLHDEVALGKTWRNIFSGHGVTTDAAKAALTDLVIESEYFAVAPPGTSTEMLHRREGKREVIARILFLLDLPSSFITELRRDALDELQKLEERANHG